MESAVDEGQGKLLPNMPLWNTDYFELKVLEKQPVQGHSDTRLFL